MLGIDTNVLVRFLTADDALQYQKAVKLFETEIIFIGDTVFLETAWVLRYSYGYDCLQISDAFRKVIGLENVIESTTWHTYCARSCLNLLLAKVESVIEGLQQVEENGIFYFMPLSPVAIGV